MLPVIWKLLPELFEIKIPVCVKLLVCVRVACWKNLLLLMVQSVLPVDMLTPFDAAAAAKKLKILLFEIVLPLLFWAVVEVPPDEKIPFEGVVAPSRIDKTHRHAACARVGDGQLLQRACSSWAPVEDEVVRTGQLDGSRISI